MYKIKKLIQQYDSKRNLDAATIALMVNSNINESILIPEICQTFNTIFNLTECGFFWSDAQGGMTDAWCTSPYFLNFKNLNSCAQYQSEGDDYWSTFTENVLAGPICGYLLPFQNARLYNSAYFKTAYEPLGIKYLLDVVLHDGERPYGAFLMMRNITQGPFTMEACDFLTSLIPTLNNLFKMQVTDIAYSDKRTVGFAILSDEGAAKYMDNVASSIVWALAFEAPGAFANPNAPDLMHQLEIICAPYVKQVRNGEQLFFSMQNRWGCFDLKFEYQTLSKQISVQLLKHIPLHTEIIHKLYFLALSPMQHLVAYLLAINSSRQHIANALGVTVETVTSHIKSIYKATNTQSSHGLLLKLIG